MPTFYEQLNLPTTASADEITSAIDRLYNQWRQLVGHPQHGTQAQQQLQLLEDIRATLTDAANRAAYDSSIGLKEKSGGLIDPSIPHITTDTTLITNISQIIYQETTKHQNRRSRRKIPHSAPKSPNSRRNKVFKDRKKVSRPYTSKHTSTQNPNTSWYCNDCNTDNPPKTQICRKCNRKITERCAICQEETPIRAEKCYFCQARLEYSKIINEIKENMTTQIAKISLTRSELIMISHSSKVNQNILLIYIITISLIISTIVLHSSYLIIAMLILSCALLPIRKIWRNPEISILIILGEAIIGLLFVLLTENFPYWHRLPYFREFIVLSLATFIYLPVRLFRENKNLKSRYTSLHSINEQNIATYKKYKESIDNIKFKTST